MRHLVLVATSTFGLEAVVKRELQVLGFRDLKVSDGRVEFPAVLSDIPRVNLELRAADRVLVKVGEFPAGDFDRLFDGVKALPWEEWIEPGFRIEVTGKSVKSRLASVRTNQAMTKKAVLERLARACSCDEFPETGPEVSVQVSLVRDLATLFLDTTGPGLHRRGYRARTGEVPLKETLAAGLVLLSFWRTDQPLVDPMCGSGTILIEAALLARRLAPGARRSFACEHWPGLDARLWPEARAAVKNSGRQSGSGAPRIFGFDSDPRRIEDSRRNARRAGVAEDIDFQCRDLRELVLEGETGVLITNPPYGVKLGESAQLPDLYRALAGALRFRPGWSVNVLTADKAFPRNFQPDRLSRTRKLYNGTLEVSLCQYDARPVSKI